MIGRSHALANNSALPWRADTFSEARPSAPHGAPFQLNFFSRCFKPSPAAANLSAAIISSGGFDQPRNQQLSIQRHDSGVGKFSGWSRR